MGGNQSMIFMLVYLAAIVVFIYFMTIRPSKKRQKAKAEMMANMKPGDYVLTNSGFYGEIVDVQEDTVVVEFGNNKNCRIPMKIAAIEQIESGSASYSQPAPKSNEVEDKEDK